MTMLNGVETHIDRPLIEADLAKGVISLRVLSGRYNVSKDALHRHRLKMKKETPKRFEALEADNWAVTAEEMEALRLETSAGWLKNIRSQYARFVHAQDDCFERGDYKMAALLGRQCAVLLKLMGEATLQLSQTSVHIEQHFTFNEDWFDLRSIIAQSLMPFPDARRAVLSAIEGYESSVPDPRLIEHEPVTEVEA